MSPEILRNPMSKLKCAKCKQPLVDPVQLGACLHILCKQCTIAVESEYFNNINCPQCGMENAKPSILNRISGIDLQANEDSGNESCDFDSSHEDAMWNCFMCAKNICSQCRSNHPLDHGDAISLLVRRCNIRVSEGTLDAAASGNIDVSDGAMCSSLGFLGSIGEDCPLCKSTSCPHIDVLELLHASPDIENAFCEVSSHKDCDGRPLLKNYFCYKCWKPVCGDCSHKGEHKLHTVKDMESMSEYLSNTVSGLKRRLSMLLAKAHCDQEDQRKVENSLKEHVESVSKEMDSRKCKILEEVTRFFNKAVDDAEYQGKDIVREYNKELEQTNALCKFLEAMSTVFNFQVDKNPNTTQYVFLLQNLHKAECLIDEIGKTVIERSRPQEHRLVLNGVDMLRPIQQSETPVRRECQQPPLAFCFKLNSDISLVHSIVVRGSDQCFVSCTMTRSRKNDAILHYRGEDSKPVETVIDVQRGRYYISRLVTGDIVASYSSDSGNAVKYYESDERLFKQGECAQFEDITKLLDFEPRGIAATKQNTILLCMALPQDKKGCAATPTPTQSDTSYLMLLSLQGKVLREAQHNATDALSPNCVAVSDSGEICVCDPKNSTIAILDPELNLKERVKFPLPTSLSNDVVQYIFHGRASTDPGITFRPEGVCYDRHGRIIVADSNNHMVVRLSRSANGKTYIMETLITKIDDHFRYPKLVALGEDGQLWVVCREYVFVFRYGI